MAKTTKLPPPAPSSPPVPSPAPLPPPPLPGYSTAVAGDGSLFALPERVPAGVVSRAAEEAVALAAGGRPSQESTRQMNPSPPMVDRETKMMTSTIVPTGTLIRHMALLTKTLRDFVVAFHLMIGLMIAGLILGIIWIFVYIQKG